MHIEEDKEKEIVNIDGFEICGHIAEENCKHCNNSKIYYADFDAYFCAYCNKWLEAHCFDPFCEYCKKRPKKPIPSDKEDSDSRKTNFKLFFIGLLIAGCISFVGSMFVELPFLVIFGITFVAMKINGFIAEKEDNEPGGFNSPK